MAILKNTLQFTGRLGILSAYKVRGSDKIILRTQGGADKETIKTSPSFKLTRDNYTEFSACARTAGLIRSTMIALTPLADYNFTPQLTSICKSLQLLDTEHERGKRRIYLSLYRDLLTGFSLNRDTVFESVVKHPIQYTFDRADASAVVSIPSLNPGINLINYKKFPYFRFIACLGALSDQASYTGRFKAKSFLCPTAYSEWFSFEEVNPECELSLKVIQDLGSKPDSLSFILSLGIQWGMPLSATLINPVKHAGSAKILGAF